MTPEAFYYLYSRLQTVAPDMNGAAIISADGTVLYQEGEIVANPGLVGVAGSAILRLAEHISSGLEECPPQKITISCKKHSALFVPINPEILLMIVFPNQADTRSAELAIHKTHRF